MQEVSKKPVEVYCGVDFHKVNSVFYAVTKEGELVEGPTTIKSALLVKYLSNRANWKIGIESSGGVNQIVEELKASGHEVVIINSNKFRGIGINGKKTDERDAWSLADCLRLNFAPEVHHKSRASRTLKSLLVQREIFVRTRVNLINHIRGTLREYGVTIPQGAENFYTEIHAKIEAMNLPILASGLSQMVEMIESLKKQEDAVEVLIAEMMKEDTRLPKLRTIPGIGPMTSYAMVAVVDDIKRFKSAKEFASYLGLTPSVSSSANKRMMGSITRSGSEILRRYLIHGARAWMRYSPQGDRNREWAERVKERRGMNKAVVALAHRLSRIAFAVLRDGSSYTGKAKKKKATVVKVEDQTKVA